MSDKDRAAASGRARKVATGRKAAPLAAKAAVGARSFHETEIKGRETMMRDEAGSGVSRQGLPVSPVLGIKAAGVDQLIHQIKQGFDYRFLERFIEKAGLPKEEAINLVQISRRTMQRRQQAGRLSPEESDRLVRAARIIDQARQLFENDAKAANRWLDTPQPALAGATPLEYAGTELGAREVEALITRLEHGTFS